MFVLMFQLAESGETDMNVQPVVCASIFRGLFSSRFIYIPLFIWSATNEVLNAS